MIKQLIILVISIGLFSSCGVTKRDKYNALNDYLDSVIKDSEEIMVIKEIVAPDLAISMFYGNDFWPKYPDTTVVTREYGIHGLVLEKGKWLDLFDKKDWSKMKKKYGSEKKKVVGESGYWKLDDFRHKKIVFENLAVFLKNKTSIYFDTPEKKVFEFSSPIRYQKKYLVFRVTGTTTKSYWGGFIDLVVVMEKVNGKWIVRGEAGPDYVI
ncbi:hypothetical protein [Flavobacterium sp.]|uniref:hypothetical protein n=1 Tax=Flavobacterium sp. TaxID=239 RepID=UPI002CBD2B2A|nr:hypothetical protein [Flavobacterium sp.]HSD06893.1 hypothetical protein [Flavobacterium sp.]